MHYLDQSPRKPVGWDRSWSPSVLNRSGGGGGGMSSSKGASRKSLVSRTLERCRSGLGGSGKVSAGTTPGCFSVYVGPERERFLVRTDRANHPLFRRLLDDAEREYGYAAQGPIALPCAVDAFLDVLWHMDHDQDHDGGDNTVAPTSSPICSLQRGSRSNKRRAAGYRVLSPAKSSPASFFSPKTSPTSGGDQASY